MIGNMDDAQHNCDMATAGKTDKLLAAEILSGHLSAQPHLVHDLSDVRLPPSAWYAGMCKGRVLLTTSVDEGPSGIILFKSPIKKGDVAFIGLDLLPAAGCVKS
jgi:hypothetical protein